MQTISVETASAITGLSKYKWRGKVESGEVESLPPDASGRTMIPLHRVAWLMRVRLSPEETDMLLRADAGDADSQAAIGSVFLRSGRASAAHYWLSKAALQNSREAMYVLARCYEDGIGVPKDEEVARMWLTKAKAHA